MVKNSCCSYCGAAFEAGSFPKTCSVCQHTTWLNPIPIVVVILPMVNKSKVGVLIQQRAIPPQKGHWALPSGYVDLGETCEQAAAREVKEEMGIDTDPNMYRLFSLTNSSDGHLLVFLEYRKDLTFDMIGFQPNEEVSAIDILYTSRELAFPSHTIQIENYFDSL